jgi:superfamily II DNA/RNA helicase
LQFFFPDRDFRSHQLDVLRHAVKGESVLAALSMGSGKTLPFALLPFVRHALGLPRRPVIVALPTLSLIQQHTITLNDMISKWNSGEQSTLAMHVKACALISPLLQYTMRRFRRRWLWCAVMKHCARVVRSLVPM